jgi:hypothetical protein
MMKINNMKYLFMGLAVCMTSLATAAERAQFNYDVCNTGGITIDDVRVQVNTSFDTPLSATPVEHFAKMLTSVGTIMPRQSPCPGDPDGRPARAERAGSFEVTYTAKIRDPGAYLKNDEKNKYYDEKKTEKDVYNYNTWIISFKQGNKYYQGIIYDANVEGVDATQRVSVLIGDVVNGRAAIKIKTQSTEDLAFEKKGNYYYATETKEPSRQ